MNSKEWDHLIGSVRKQIDELRTAIEQNETAACQDKKSLEDAAHEVEQLLESPSNPRAALYQLPLTLQALTSQKLIGVFLLGTDGKIVLHHGSGQRLLRIDPHSNRLPTGCFYDGPNGNLINEIDLPWQRCLRGETVPTSLHLVVKDQLTTEELHLEVSAVPLKNGDDISGVVTLFRDKTETVKAGKYIKELCHTFEKQLCGIEAAQRELKLFAESVLETTGSRRSAGGRMTPETVPLTTESKPSTGKGVLIVDDIPVNQKLLMMQLKKLGVETDIANNGMEAVTMCKRQSYALVLMDLDMPIMNGWEATAEIRKYEAGGSAHVPIIAVSSFDGNDDRDKCLQEGMDDFMPKGANKEALQRLASRFIFGQKDGDETAEAPIERAVNSAANDDLKLDLAWLQDAPPAEKQKVVALFLGSAAMLLNCLEFALQDKDAQSVTHFAFSLKGPCSSMGLTPMADRAAGIVEDAMKNRWYNAEEKYMSLRFMFNTVNEQAKMLSENQQVAYPV